MLVNNVPRANVDAKNKYDLTALDEIGVVSIPTATDVNSDLIRKTLASKSTVDDGAAKLQKLEKEQEALEVTMLLFSPLSCSPPCSSRNCCVVVVAAVVVIVVIVVFILF